MLGVRVRGLVVVCLLGTFWSCGAEDAPGQPVVPPPSQVSQASADRRVPASHLDLTAVVDRAGRALSPVAERPGAVGTDDPSYRLEAVGTRAELSLSRGRGAGGDGASETPPTLQIETQSIRLGDHEHGGPETTAVDGNELITLRGGGITERLAAKHGAVEQLWELGSRPADSEDATFFVGLGGLPFAGESLGGLHYLDRGIGPGFVVSHATVVDAAGDKIVVRLQPQEGGFVLRVPGAWLAAARYPVTVDPTFSAEITMDAPVGTGPMTDSQTNAAAAFGGGSFLVVWEDARGGSGEMDIFATRVSTAGAPLDVGGIVVSAVVGSQQLRPDIAFDGTNFLVVWDDRRFGGGDIYGARISTAGVNLDPDGIEVVRKSCEQTYPALAWDGTEYLLAFQEQRTNSSGCLGSSTRVSTSVLSAAGLAASTGNAVTAVSSTQASPDVAWNGENFIVVWQENRAGGSGTDIVGARVASSGTTNAADAAIGKALSTGPNNEINPAVASDGNEVLLAWQDPRNGTNDIAAEIVKRDMSTSCPGGTCPVFVAQSSTDSETAPAVAWAGAYLLAWQQLASPAGATVTDVFARKLDASGNLTGGLLTLANATGDQTAVALAADGASTFFAVWTDGRVDAASPDIYGTPVTSSVLIANGALLSLGTPEQRSIAVASSGSDYLVVWQDLRAGSSYDVIGVPVSAAGVPGAALTIAADPGGVVADQRSPAVAFGGGRYLVVWQQSNQGSATGFDIYGQRVTAAGVLQGGAILVSNDAASPATGAGGAQTAPTVTYDRTTDTGAQRFIVAWEDTRAGASDVYATSVAGDGTVVTNGGFAAVVTSGSQTRPDIAMADTSALVVFRDGGAGDAIGGQRVSGTGLVGAPITVVSGGIASADNPAVSWNGAHWLVVWQDFGSSDVQGQRVAGDGSLAGAVLNVSLEVGNQTVPAVAWDGEDNWYVAWQDTRNGNADVFLARISATGSVVDASGLAVTDTTNPEGVPAIATLAANDTLAPVERQNRALVAYEARPGGGTPRAIGKIFKDLLALGQACSVNANCDSNFCVDGVCCNNACGGGNSGDCQACSAAAGSTGANGVCSAANASSTCRPATGACDLAELCDGVSLACPADVFAVAGATCEGTYFCRDGETCDGAGTCVAASGSAHSCNDGNVCHLSTCDEVGDRCDNSNLANGTSCANATVCDGAETCQAGTCTAGTALDCNDSNPCTQDSCNAVSGCQNTNLAAGASCEGTYFCRDGETCDGAGTCVAASGSAHSCNDGNACHLGLCDEAGDRCDNSNLANGTSCANGTVCDGAETCQGGTCTAGTALNCNDSNPCTQDSCNAVSGCQSTVLAAGTSCEGTYFCRDGETCDGAGTCAAASGSVHSCSDGNACHTAACNEASDRCDISNVANGTSCANGTVCDGAETCQAGACTTGTALDCNDSNPCTQDSCNAVSGCQNTNLAAGTSCEGTYFCRDGETCDGAGTCGAASGSAHSCSDGNACHVAACNEASDRCDISNVANGTSCANGTVCDGAETCQAGACTTGTALTCNDGNPCTQDSCNAISGCQFDGVPLNGASCSDGNACNGNETCAAGSCAAGTPVICDDGDVCTSNVCNPVSGACTFPAIPACGDAGAADAGDGSVEEAGSDAAADGGDDGATVADGPPAGGADGGIDAPIDAAIDAVVDAPPGSSDASVNDAGAAGDSGGPAGDTGPSSPDLGADVSQSDDSQGTNDGSPAGGDSGAGQGDGRPGAGQDGGPGGQTDGGPASQEDSAGGGDGPAGTGGGGGTGMGGAGGMGMGGMGGAPVFMDAADGDASADASDDGSPDDSIGSRDAGANGDVPPADDGSPGSGLDGVVADGAASGDLEAGAGGVQDGPADAFLGESIDGTGSGTAGATVRIPFKGGGGCACDLRTSDGESRGTSWILLAVAALLARSNRRRR